MNSEDVYRGKLINDLCETYGLSRVLELGVDKGFTWNQISCVDKIGVDANPNILNYDLRFKDKIQITTTDSFFQNNNCEFDLVFIDACHEKGQVYKDFKNSFECLSSNGIILFHDVFPRSEAGTKLSGHGNVYQLWMEMYNIYELFTYIDNYNDDSVGIFYKEKNPEWKDINSMNNTFQLFWENRDKYVYDICENENYKEKPWLKKY